MGIQIYDSDDLKGAYQKGRLDAIDEFLKIFWKSEIEFRPSQIDEILRIAEKLKEPNK